MPPTIVSSTQILPAGGQEVSFGTIVGGPFDYLDVFVDGSGNIDADEVIAEWRIYATAGGLTSLVASAPGGGSRPAVIEWDIGSSEDPGLHSPAEAAGTTFELRGLLQQPAAVPITFLASLIGYDEFDVVASATAGATVALPATGAEVTIATVAGYAQFADVSVLQNFNVPVRFTLYAQATAVGVTAEVKTMVLQSTDGTRRVFSPVELPGATSYILRARLEEAGPSINVTASLATRSNTVTTGGVVLLTGNTNGPSNANTEEAFVTSTTDADVHVAAQLHPKGAIYEGLNGLTADRTVFLNTTATGAIGDDTTVKDEDGSLALHNIILDPGAGNTIDGLANYTMTAAQNGLKGAVTVRRISATAWALI